MVFVSGYAVFLPGKWNTATFFFSYTMVGVVPLLFVFWKVFHKTQVSHEERHPVLHALSNLIQSGENSKISHSFRQKDLK